MTTNIYTKIDVELSNEEGKILNNAMGVIRDLNEIMDDNNLNELWYHTYDGDGMMTKAQVQEIYMSLYNIINMCEIM